MIRRRRKSRNSVAPKGKYAQIPVAEAKAIMREVSAPEFRVWFALCAQCQHWSNGTGKLCRSVIREFHLGSQRVVTTATKKLIEAGRIVRTRESRQRKCALYGVVHLPLNTEAMAAEGLTDADIRRALRGFARASSDSNRGSASGATASEALNDKTNVRGSAKPRALPEGKRISPFLDPLALPQRNMSKNLPSALPTSDKEHDDEVTIARMVRAQEPLPDGDVSSLVVDEVSRLTEAQPTAKMARQT